jgi:virginiamycin B lyase
LKTHITRPRAAALVAIAALAALAACSGGSSTLPSVGAAASLITPKSISPALVRPAPMASTAILPSSAMASKHPAAAVQGLGWSQLPGVATQVAAASDGSIWVLSDGPAGPDKNIWHYAGGTWTNVGGLASQIAVAPNGTLYAINSGGGTYAYSGGSWTGLGGGASAITTVSDNSIYVLTNGGTGDRAIWHNTGGVWTQAVGSGTALFGSIDPGTYAVGGGTVSPGGYYIINSLGAIYYENADGSLVQLPGNASSIASTTNGGTFALGSPVDPNGNSLYYFDLDAPGWSAQSGVGVSISSSAGSLYVVATSGAIFTTAVTPVATPTPTASPTPASTSGGGATPFPTPSATPNLTLSCNTSAQRCGVQRWHTKTLDDVDEYKINWTPVSNTVTEMTQFPVPPSYSEYGPGGNDVGRFPPYEIEVFTVRALLIKRKHETGSSGDDDYHIEIADPDNPAKTMVTEAPHGECTYACASGFGGFMDGIRNELDTCFGPATSSFQAFPAGVIVKFTGVGFFDGLHGQTGALANPGSPASNFELHPLLSMEFVSGKPNVAGC